MRRIVALGCALSGFLGASSAQADVPEIPPVELKAPPPCIDAATFRARLAALPRATASAPPRAVSIRITREDGTFTGELSVTHGDGSTTHRRVDSAVCDEVTDALEFVTALALGLERRPPPPPAPAVAPVAPPVHPPAPPERSRWRFLASVRGDLVGGAGPKLEPAFGGAIGLRLDTPGVVAPSFELSGRWATSGSFEAIGGTAQTTLTLANGAAEVCPVRIALGGGVAVRPCAEVAAGIVSGSGSLLGGTTSSTSTPWFAVAPLARAEWLVADRLFLEVEGGPSFDLLPRRFFFPSNPNSPVYTSPIVGSVVRVGVGVLFP